EFGYGVVIPIIDSTGNKSVEQPLLPKLDFEVSPNPASEYFLVDYQLPVTKFQNAEFVMYNSDSRKVYSQPITKYWYQLLVETDNILPGFYVCKLFMDNTELAKRGIIIKPDLMTVDEKVKAEKQLSEFDEIIFESNKFLLIFPNPANDFVQLVCDYKSQTASNIEIVDAQGKILITEKFDAQNNILKINTSMLSNGIYSVNLINDGEILATEKLVIE
ncbi:MAG: T9SS type A sorting domain-containing protein, partial [Bacteroidales bacterium]|nr:T9SS type A sorting domain-containing protein [Bacteroidales bacterium]